MQILIIKVHKSLNHQSSSFLWDLFARKEINYNLRIKDLITFPKALTTTFGENSISFWGSILWNSTPDVTNTNNTVFTFIKKPLKTDLI